MPCSTISSLNSSTRYLSYFILQNTYLHILKSPNLLVAYLVKYLLYEFYSVTKSFLVSLFFQTSSFFSPWSSLSLTLWSMYILLISLILCQSIPFTLRFCINLVWFTWPSVQFSSVQFSSLHILINPCKVKPFGYWTCHISLVCSD